MMKKTLLIFFLLYTFVLSAQTDYSNSWEDFYSYNNVKDFVKVNEIIYALVDNAVFTFNLTTKETKKFSSIQGLSGKTTTTLYYHTTLKRLIIGYENGLLEIVDENGTINVSADIVNFNQSGEKSINHISEFNKYLYISTSFAIVVYDIEKLEFGDTYFIANNSRSIKINQTAILDNKIYAATEEGIFSADLSNSNLVDFNNWQQNFNTNFNQITIFNDELYASTNSALYKIEAENRILIRDFSENIIGIKNSETNLSIALKKRVFIFDINLNEIYTTTANETYDYTLNNVFFENTTLFLATKEFGILTLENLQSGMYEEIHPEGPLSNDIFSINAQNNNLWVVYGGYDSTFTPSQKKQGFSHFNGETWINIPFNPDFPAIDLVYITVDPNNQEKIYISSFGDTNSVNSVSTGGLLVVENDEITGFYNHLNSELEDILPNNPLRVTIRINSTIFDRQGNLWITNIGVDNKLKKLSPSGQWSSYNLSSIQTNSAPGLSEIAIDKGNSLWIGSRRNGVYVYNENGNRKRALVTGETQGNLPDLRVKTVAIDNNNRVWLGTLSGLVVYNNALGVFDADIVNAEPIIILDDGIPKKLLGDQSVNTIEIDGADNKWFGTDNGGVIYTNPNGQTTLENFSTENSPLPSNKILKIKVDISTGKVFFATDKGIVAYNSEVSPFGETLNEVYAYPNPALKNHERVVIDGRNGTHLPKGTNVKILDVAGNLVYETNVVEGQELQGGKVVWNKTNLAGKKVASGIYIVLLINEDGSQTAMTKIAIVN